MRGGRNEEIDAVLTSNLGEGIASEAFAERADVEQLALGAKDGDHALGGFEQMAEGGFAAFLGERELATFGQPDHAGAEGVELKRLEDVVGRALSERGDRALEVGVAGNDDDVGGWGGATELGQQGFGAGVGELTVEDDEIDGGPVVAVESLAGAAGQLDAVAVDFEQVAQVGSGVGVILDDEDVQGFGFHGHGGESWRSTPRSRVRRSR